MVLFLLATECFLASIIIIAYVTIAATRIGG